MIYHSIGSGPWAVSEYAFITQLEWLQRVARLTSLEQLLGQNLEDSLQVAITFDDGYASLREQALPILKVAGAVATVFLNTGQVAAGGLRNISNAALGYYPDELFLSQRDVVELAAEGWSIGSHGVGHLDLTRTGDDEAREELGASKRAIEKLLSAECKLFAYTWGRHDRRVRNLVAETGYRHAFSGWHGPLRADSDRWALPRINVASEYAISDFKATVLGDWDYIGWIQKIKAGL